MSSVFSHLSKKLENTMFQSWLCPVMPITANTCEGLLLCLKNILNSLSCRLCRVLAPITVILEGNYSLFQELGSHLTSTTILLQLMETLVLLLLHLIMNSNAPWQPNNHQKPLNWLQTQVHNKMVTFLEQDWTMFAIQWLLPSIL